MITKPSRIVIKTQRESLCCESLQSNSDSQANEREYVLNILGGNDYPKRFLNDCLRSL